MVLTADKKSMLALALCFFNAALGFSDTSVSGLIQYGENIDTQRLQLLEDRQIMRIDTDGYSMSSTYTIRNSGGEYNATLGLSFDGTHDYANYATEELQFYVDGRPVPHSEPVSVQQGMYLTIAWALIGVQFPEYSVVTVQVRYLRRNEFLSHGLANVFSPCTDDWQGPTEFSIEIINNRMASNNITEDLWISNIFFRGTPVQNHGNWKSISTMRYLQGIQKLDTNLMKIQRPSGNTIRIEFTQDFLDSYRRGFEVTVKSIGNSFNDVEYGYFIFGNPFDYDSYHTMPLEINLPFLESHGNITKRLLAPYELVFLTASQLRIMRNAFYARHGFVFQSEDLQNFFGSLWNYQPNPDFTEDMLTETDRANIATIQRLEALAGD